MLDEYFGEIPENMFGMYGIIGIKIERFKDKYKNKADMYKKEEFGKFFFYDYLEDLKTNNLFFNNLLAYIGILILLLLIIWIDFDLKIIYIIYLLIILLKIVESIIYSKILELRKENVYENGYFIKGFGVKDDTYCNIEHISLHIEDLHLELMDKLEKAFNYKIIDDTIYSFEDLQNSNKKR